MVNKDSLLENLSIYNDNLSVYYVGSVFVTVLSVILAWWYHKSIVGPTQEGEHRQLKNEMSDYDSSHSFTQVADKSEIGYEDNKTNIEEEVVSKIKLVRSSKIAEEVASTLTEDQLQEEREVERQQLEAIFQLLQNQEDKFQVSSIQELEDQLKLYRP